MDWKKKLPSQRHAERLQELYASGLNFSEIALKTNLTRQGVRDNISRNADRAVLDPIHRKAREALLARRAAEQEAQQENESNGPTA